MAAFKVATEPDADGILECSNSCPDDKEKIEPSSCGCNVPEMDTDGDGTLDSNDDCLKTKLQPRLCGGNVPVRTMEMVLKFGCILATKQH